MKKLRLLLIVFVFSVFSAQIFAQNSSFFSSEITAGTGIPIYDDNVNSERKLILDTSDYKRIVVGLSYNACFSISEPIRIILGADILSDFVWNDGLYYNTLDYAFCAGIKIYPGAQGLNLGINYTLGNRTDFLNVDSATGESGEKQTNTRDWGNGFKLIVQYDFMTASENRVKPVLGAYYRCIPRGSNLTDHTLCIYGGVKL